MKIHARLHNAAGRHEIGLSTNGNAHAIQISPGPTGFGSRVNGCELLFLVLATCYCNDLYREAARAGIDLVGVEVEGDFGGPGDPARNVTYRAKGTARGATEEAVLRLIEHTDGVAEVHNTLRRGVDVTLTGMEVELKADRRGY